MGRFDQLMMKMLEYGNAPGAQLAVSKGGQLKYFKALGVANRETSEPLTTNHVMRFASISEVFAGTAILKLVQEGKLSLEDKPFGLLKNLEPPRGAIVEKRLLDITIQNLLQHTGGWNRTGTGLDAGGLDASLYASQTLGCTPPPTPNETIRFIKGLPLDFDPGSAMEYANYGYLVLWFLNLSYGSADVSSMDSYRGLIGSAGDIVKSVDHMDGLRQPAILKADMVSAMLNAPMPEKRFLKGDSLYDHSQGLHVFVSIDNDRHGNITSFQHDGGLVGTSTFFMRLMEENITFAYLLNTRPSNADFEYVTAANLSQVFSEKDKVEREKKWEKKKSEEEGV